MSATTLELQRVTKAFGDFGVPVLEDLSFRFEEGRAYGIVGANGAGKTVLLNLISGVDRPDRGRVLLRGEDVTSLGVEDRCRRGIGRGFQSPRTCRTLSIRDNFRSAVRDAAAWDGVSLAAESILHPVGARALPGDGETRVDGRLDGLSLAGEADKAAGIASFGEAKLVGMGRALCTDPFLLLLDEPLAGLHVEGDTRRLDAIRRQLAEFTASGGTALVVEHNVGLLADMVDELLVLERVGDGGAALRVASDASEVADRFIGMAGLGAGTPWTFEVAPFSRRRVTELWKDEPSLVVEDLTVELGGRRVLEHLTMALPPPGAPALVCVGRNAVGKSTLLKAIAGLVPVRSGRLFLHGRDITHWPASRRIGAGIVLHLQGGQVFGDLSPRDNLRLAARRSRGPVSEAVDRLVESAGLARRAIDRPASLLSGGQRQLLALEMLRLALEAGAAVVLMDEPSAGLAPGLARRVFEGVFHPRRETNGRASVLVVEQNPRALSFASSGYLLSDGQVFWGSRDPAQVHGPSRSLRDALFSQRHAADSPPPDHRGAR